MEAVAKLRNCPMSPRKMRLVVDNIRGRKVVDALGILKYTNNDSTTFSNCFSTTIFLRF